MRNLGRALLEEACFERAEQVLGECLEINRRIRPDAWESFNAASLQGHALFGLKRYAEAEALLVRAYEGMLARRDSIPAPMQNNISGAALLLVQLYERWGKPEQAELWRQKLPLRERFLDTSRLDWPMLWGWPRCW
jgi:non-specific serine/threonine protein kinase/serine/threonine-protein kinase